MDALIGAIRARREEALKDASPEEWAQYSGLRELPPMWDPDCWDDEPIEEFDDSDREYLDWQSYELRHPLED
jgi:hypothetical protein